ncbi:DUF1311 domain-containing protein [Rhodopseudomonas palustris]|uniref:lysozyme inhibitor LprI family protein n=1 Tax=Rhodopseudomonas palustris TaxID=1076 RepID=UPI00115C5858|nr:lysozyme inhibitor LprI family protein [Rhodopseudomonas palustris]QDL99779.1 DUF1311 domain-containing protein [Rhodopseudomonas palustris]
MMTKRSIVDEILDLKKRQGKSKLGADLGWKVDNLIKSWTCGAQTQELADFIPIRLATILEVYIRETVRDLIDSDPKYLDRAESLTRGTKLDFVMFKSLQGRRVSVGDIVSHSIPISSLDHILSICDSLCPKFREKLPHSRELWIEDHELSCLPPPILGNAELVLKAIKRIFEVRHILVHEMAQERPYSIEEIPEFLTATKDFISATDWIFVGETTGPVPRSQMTMNITAGERLELAMRELEELLASIRPMEQSDASKFDAAQKAWEVFADADASFHAAEVEGGSMYPMVWAMQKEERVRERTAALRRWLDNERSSL